MKFYLFRNNFLKKIRYYLSPLKHFFVENEYRVSVMNIFLYILFYNRKNKIIFHDRLAVHRQFTHSTIEKLTDQFNEKITLFVSDKLHEDYLQKSNSNLKVLYISPKYLHLFKYITNKVFITAASHISKHEKPGNSITVHMFHSLVSVHYVYSENAFDEYDVFFATGPHHIEELERTGRIRNWKDKIFLKTGYPKLDYFDRQRDDIKSPKQTILLAPSWTEQNLLRLHGVEIIQKVCALGFEIIVRPHPHSFTEDADVIIKIKELVRNNSLCTLEDSNTKGMRSFQKADVLISDWSGAAYEYAFGLLKPVLFIDTPPKFDNNFIQKEFRPMEDLCRNRVGIVSGMDDFEVNLLKIMEDNADWKSKIKQVRSEYLYHFGCASDKAAEEIVRIKRKKRNDHGGQCDI